MWSTLSVPWQASLEQAWQAYVEGALPIGAALARPDGQIVSVGRNRTRGGAYTTVPRLTGHRLAHAELDALMQADLSSPEAHTYELYTTQEPCPMCLGALVMANLTTVHYAAEPWAGSTALLQATPYLRGQGVQAIPVTDQRLDAVCLALAMQPIFLEPQERARPHLAHYRATRPAAVRVGTLAYERQVLGRLRDQGAEASMAVDALARLYKQMHLA